MDLQEFFKRNPISAIGFSGGVDSAYLLYAAKKYNADIQPYYIKTAFQPQSEYNDVSAICDKLNIKIKIVGYDILSEQNIISNPADRCYHCKKAMFSLLKKNAERDGYNLILDGTNASDILSDRPGAKALEELGVLSPLRICGLTKEKIRELSKKAGLFTWNKPSYSCLATRIQTGETITAELLNKVECSENALMEMGFSDLRIRVYDDTVKIQIKQEQFPLIADKRGDILKQLDPYFKTILLDMKAR